MIPFSFRRGDRGEVGHRLRIRPGFSHLHLAIRLTILYNREREYNRTG